MRRTGAGWTGRWIARVGMGTPEGDTRLMPTNERCTDQKPLVAVANQNASGIGEPKGRVRCPVPSAVVHATE